MVPSKGTFIFTSTLQAHTMFRNYVTQYSRSKKMSAIDKNDYSAWSIIIGLFAIVYLFHYFLLQYQYIAYLIFLYFSQWLLGYLRFADVMMSLNCYLGLSNISFSIPLHWKRQYCFVIVVTRVRYYAPTTSYTIIGGRGRFLDSAGRSSRDPCI